MKIILKTPKFIKDLIKMFEYPEPVRRRRVSRTYRSEPVKRVAGGCPYCGSPKFVQLTTRKLCTNCHETYNRMKTIKFDPPLGPSRITPEFKAAMMIKKE